MEKFFQFGKVEFINDSKGTNIDSTIKALEGYDDKIILICGGKDKKLDLSPLVEKIATASKSVFLIGEIADKLENSLLDIGYPGEIHNLELLDNVVKYLVSSLNPEEGDTVLFSPASSSFDQFKNFEDRGKYFKDLVLRTFKK
jgi:UDP-N-acetylmuramoylalanine--D-glutamate ligase